MRTFVLSYLGGGFSVGPVGDPPLLGEWLRFPCHYDRTTGPCLEKRRDGIPPSLRGVAAAVGVDRYAV